ncbi:hypothetical protein SAMN05192589_106146 [Paracidovorax valerianellae]|uniref:Lipoprotein n=1 Tax=Paracidovorax valerianellae TaxID=187868 RepID=A0A1G6UQR7_9BURK|nr:hypothetical protein SAMN05192589_106146 [Paracidovorax valerianellae]
MATSFQSFRTAAAFAAFAAFSAASLTACGGGGGGGDVTTPPGTSPTPAPAPAPSSGTSSAACYNAADFNEGTVLVEEGITKMDGQPDLASTSTTTTGARQDFAGARPVMFTPQSTGALGNNRQFRDRTSTSELAYGVVSDTSTQVLTQVYDPPVSTPLDMQPGQVVKRDHKNQFTIVPKAGSAPSSFSETVEDQFTYVGRESLQTAMGSLNVCKFNNDFVTVGPTGRAVANIQTWVVAEGPYQGRLVKIATSSSNGRPSTYEVTKITYTPK